MDNNKAIDEQLKEVKRSFRLMMNGMAAQSMRAKGLDYHVNWGVSLPSLRGKAKEIGKNYGLALALWKEDVRECKILATMTMPPDVILPEVVDIWMEQTHTLEIAEQAAFNLYQHLPYAAEKAYNDGDLQLALELCTLLEKDTDTSGLSSVLKLKSTVLYALSDMETSANGRHYYIACAKEAQLRSGEL